MTAYQAPNPCDPSGKWPDGTSYIRTPHLMALGEGHTMVPSSGPLQMSIAGELARGHRVLVHHPRAAKPIDVVNPEVRDGRKRA